MKKIAILALCLILISACAPEPVPVDENAISIYYLAHEGTDISSTYITAEQHSIGEHKEVYDSCMAAIELMENPTDKALSSALHGTLCIPEIAISDTTVTVDMCEHYLDLTSVNRTLTSTAFALTLLQIGGVDFVTITCNGQPYPPIDNFYFTEDNTHLSPLL